MLLTASAWLDPAQPDVITVFDSEDAGFSAIPSEQELNFGGSSNRRIKGHQDLMVMKFDLVGDLQILVLHWGESLP